MRYCDVVGLLDLFPIRLRELLANLVVLCDLDSGIVFVDK